MSTETERGPQWDMADRMRKALRHAGLGVQDMADYLGVSTSSVSGWINGRVRPRKPAIRLFAMRCGVPLGWLAGDEHESGDRPFRTTALGAAA